MEDHSFSKREMAAIIKLAKTMAAADGKLDKAEMSMISHEALRFGIMPDDFKALLSQGDNLKPEESLAIIAVMNDAQKRYVTAYLGTMMTVDGEVDDTEMKLWRFVSAICKLPTMTVNEAISYMNN